MAPISAPTIGDSDGSDAANLMWCGVGLAFAALVTYSSTYLWTHTWNDEAYAHGPLVLALIVWVVWRQPLPPLRAPGAGAKAIGWIAFAAGLALYVVGRSQGLPALDVGGLPFVATGMLIILGGMGAAETYLYPILFLVFLIPLPPEVLETVTGPMRHFVSVLSEGILHALGYPVGRSGVTLTIGKYQLLVADTCSGINSLLSLSTMSLMYVYLMGKRNVWRNVALMSLVVPIAVVANLVRVLFLVLLTYYAGDEAGQGFMHGFAGMFLFVVALAMVVGADRMLGRVSERRRIEGVLA